MTKDMLTELLCAVVDWPPEEQARLLAVVQGMELERAMHTGQNG